MNPFTGPDFISDSLRKKLLDVGTTKLFSEGALIVSENVFIRAIPIVLSGNIRVMRSDEDGREILLYYIQPGESCIMSFLGGLHQDTSKVKAVAEEETEVLFIPLDKVSLFIREFPEWLEYIFKLYHKRFEELLSMVNAVAFKKMDNRLLELIRKKAELHNSTNIPVTHTQLANELGTAREVVSRLLKQLETEGVIRLGRNKIELV